MPNYSLDHDPDYWQAPERFRPMFESSGSIGNKASLFALGDANDDDTPMVFILKMEPGFILTQHAHPCERLEVIVRGSLIVGDKTYVPGDILTAAPEELYGPKIAGPEGCTTAEVFAKATGAYERITEDETGKRATANLITGFGEAFAEQRRRHEANLAAKAESDA